MAEIPIDFSEPLASYIHSQIGAGRYSTIADYLSDLVRADRHEQELIERLNEHAELSTKLDHGLASGYGRRWSAGLLGELRSQVIDRSRQT